MAETRFPGHSMVRHGPGDWRCTCGVPLSGGPYGTGRAGARDAMRFHRTDLWMASPGGQAALSAAIERLEARQQ